LKYFKLQKEIPSPKEKIMIKEINEGVLEFTQLFIEKVLKGYKEVNFEIRAELDRRVRELGDSQILAQWNNFLESKSEAEIQEEVIKLLNLLIVKIRR
jgi:hypothetical protein